MVNPCVTTSADAQQIKYDTKDHIAVQYMYITRNNPKMYAIIADHFNRMLVAFSAIAVDIHKNMALLDFVQIYCRQKCNRCGT